jgi:hypothetical protein
LPAAADEFRRWRDNKAAGDVEAAAKLIPKTPDADLDEAAEAAPAIATKVAASSRAGGPM